MDRDNKGHRMKAFSPNIKWKVFLPDTEQTHQSEVAVVHGDLLNLDNHTIKGNYTMILALDRIHRIVLEDDETTKYCYDMGQYPDNVALISVFHSGKPLPSIVHLLMDRTKRKDFAVWLIVMLQRIDRHTADWEETIDKLQRISGSRMSINFGDLNSSETPSRGGSSSKYSSPKSSGKSDDDTLSETTQTIEAENVIETRSPSPKTRHDPCFGTGHIPQSISSDDDQNQTGCLTKGCSPCQCTKCECDTEENQENTYMLPRPDNKTNRLDKITQIVAAKEVELTDMKNMVRRFNEIIKQNESLRKQCNDIVAKQQCLKRELDCRKKEKQRIQCEFENQLKESAVKQQRLRCQLECKERDMQRLHCELAGLNKKRGLDSRRLKEVSEQNACLRRELEGITDKQQRLRRALDSKERYSKCLHCECTNGDIADMQRFKSLFLKQKDETKALKVHIKTQNGEIAKLRGDKKRLMLRVESIEDNLRELEMESNRIIHKKEGEITFLIDQMDKSKRQDENECAGIRKLKEMVEEMSKDSMKKEKAMDQLIEDALALRSTLDEENAEPKRHNHELENVSHLPSDSYRLYDEHRVLIDRKQSELKSIRNKTRPQRNLNRKEREQKRSECQPKQERQQQIRDWFRKNAVCWLGWILYTVVCAILRR